MDPYKGKEKQNPSMKFEIFEKYWEVKWEEIELELIFWEKLEFEVHKIERNNCNGLVKKAEFMEQGYLEWHFRIKF